MANGNSAMASLYLKIIATLCAILLALMAWSMSGAVDRNDADHVYIKSIQATKADRRDIDRIEKSIEQLIYKIDKMILSDIKAHER